MAGVRRSSALTQTGRTTQAQRIDSLLRSEKVQRDVAKDLAKDSAEPGDDA